MSVELLNSPAQAELEQAHATMAPTVEDAALAAAQQVLGQIRLPGSGQRQRQ